MFLSYTDFTSIISSFLTTLNGSLNVFIYFFKHHKLVVGLVFPNAGQSESSHNINQNRKRRSSLMFHRKPSRTILLRQYHRALGSLEATSDSVRRGSLQSLRSNKKGNASYEAHQETTVVKQKWV